MIGRNLNWVEAAAKGRMLWRYRIQSPFVKKNGLQMKPEYIFLVVSAVKIAFLCR
jgi:hypothetical protein